MLPSPLLSPRIDPSLGEILETDDRRKGRVPLALPCATYRRSRRSEKWLRRSWARLEGLGTPPGSIRRRFCGRANGFRTRLPPSGAPANPSTLGPYCFCFPLRPRPPWSSWTFPPPLRGGTPLWRAPPQSAFGSATATQRLSTRPALGLNVLAPTQWTWRDALDGRWGRTRRERAANLGLEPATRRLQVQRLARIARKNSPCPNAAPGASGASRSFAPSQTGQRDA
jgi:hypothetical protein